MQLYNIIVYVTICLGAWALCSQATVVAPITNLPGLTDKINFTQYSGYITVDNTRGKNLFFWFVESQNNPAKDPVVLWLNGGPGCSSVLGFLTEHGPFTVRKYNNNNIHIVKYADLTPQKESDGKTLKLNPYSWNKVANMIYVEAPIGVGFSYALDKNYTVGDNSTAADNYRFVLEWFKQFYKFKNNDFYIAGESYAGHYVPELAYQIARGKNDINFKGFMAGNPSFDGFYDVNGYFDFIANHGLLNEVDYENAKKICNGVIYPNNNKTCTDIVSQLITSNTKYINPYNIYAPCLGAGPDPHGGCFTHGTALNAGPRSQTFVPCIAVDYVVKYVNQASVKAALHVSSNSFQDWDVCSSHIQYVQYEPTMFTYYKALMNGKLKILVYSGDADSCVPYLGTERCVRALNLPVKSAWQPWFVTDELGYTQNGGYLIKYAQGVSFITIKGAGHMVPTYKPLEALAFFTNYLNGELN